MTDMVPIQFGIKSAQAASGVVSLERCLNMYPDQAPQGAKSPVVLYGTPGLKAWSSVGSGPIRGMHVGVGAMWVVSGTTLYHVSTGKVAAEIGEVAGIGYCNMIDNGTQVAITTNDLAYCATATSITALPEAALNGAAYQDGYGIFTQRGTQNFWLSGLDDLSTISGLDFSTADALPDYVVGCVSDHRELWLFKEHSIEIWQNTGDAAFPFQRAGGGFIERGCGSGQSIVKADNAVYWLGDDGRVYRASSYSPERISTTEIELLIESAADSTTGAGFIYEQSGHIHYVLNFSDLTIVYDLTTGLWHERISDGESRWRANVYADFAGAQLVGDFETGDIYELDQETYSDNGSTILREVIAPPIHGGGVRVFQSELYIDTETGIGLTSGQGSDPQWMLDWSDDGGATWSNEIWGPGGALGNRKTRLRFTRLGSFYQRSYRLRLSDPVKPVILGAYARTGLGVS